MLMSIGGLATGIGSLPGEDARAAVGLVLRYFPEIPHWPQLPRRGPVEHFVYQFLYPLFRLGLLVEEGGRVYLATRRPDWAERLTEFYTVYLALEAGDEAALDYFAVPPEAAAGLYAFVQEAAGGDFWLVKGQVAGPLTVGLNLRDADGRVAYYRDELRELLVHALVGHVRWQVRLLSRLGRPVLLFVDEPGVGVYGQFGYITITRERIVEDLGAVLGGIRAQGAHTGVHSCAACDWSLVFEAGPDVVSVDAYGFFKSLLPYVTQLGDFLRRGGVVAWGTVPTSEAALGESVATLLARLRDQWTELAARGIPWTVLRRQALITPACGTGLLEPALAEDIYRLTAGVARAVRTEPDHGGEDHAC